MNSHSIYLLQITKVWTIFKITFQFTKYQYRSPKVSVDEENAQNLTHKLLTVNNNVRKTKIICMIYPKIICRTNQPQSVGWAHGGRAPPLLKCWPPLLLYLIKGAPYKKIWGPPCKSPSPPTKWTHPTGLGLTLK